MTELEKALNLMDGEGPLPAPSVLPAPFASANPKTQAEIDAVAQQIRESGIPDVLNRWVGMTPEKLAENERARARTGKRAMGAKKPKPEKGAVSTGLPKGGLDEVGKKLLVEQRAAAETKKTERLAALRASKAKPSDGQRALQTLKTRKATGPKEANAKPAKPASETTVAEPTSKQEARRNRSASKTEKMMVALQCKDGVTNADLAKAMGSRPSAATMRSVCEARKLKFAVIKKEGEPTRYRAQ